MFKAHSHTTTILTRISFFILMLILAVSSCFSVIGKMSSHGMSALNSSVIHSHDEVSDDDVKSSIFLKHDVKHNAADHSHENPVLPFSDVSTLNIKT